MITPSTRPRAERLLVQTLQSDKSIAFATLYTSYARALRGVLVKMVKDPSRADDLLQDAFLRIWTNLQSYDDKRGRLFTWLLTITRNVALDELNSRRRHLKLKEYIQYQAIQEEYLPAPEADVCQSLFALLAPKYRQIMEFTCQGYTHEEVSRQLGLPLGTVKTRYRTGLHKLKLLLNQDIYYYANYYDR